MKIRGIRGATTVASNTKEEILYATKEMMAHINSANNLQQDDVAAVFFTATPDLNTVYPAQAVREMGWTLTPLMCCQEMQVVGSLEKCIRVIVLTHTGLDQEQIQHCYLRGAQILRPDLVKDLHSSKEEL